jgi:PAS domain-containing protein
MNKTPILLVNLEGLCTYASSALAELLQCGLHELYGTGWRNRISPFADDGPFDARKAIALARAKEPIRLTSPDGRSSIVSRIRVVTDPDDRSKVTGFIGRVQLVRLHKRIVPIVATTAAATA